MAVASDFLIGANDEHGLNPPTVGKRTPIISYIGRSFYENEFNNQAKLMFILACLRCGFNVLDIHPEIQDVSVSTRVVRANRAGVSLLVTFAYNASGDGTSFNSARGIEVYYSPFNSFASDSRRLSELVFQKLVENTNVPGRFVGTLSVGVLSNVRAPSTLIEAGFMTNFVDAKLMLNPFYVVNVAEATCEAVCEFLGVAYVPRELNNYPTLRSGSTGNFVKILQYLLNWYGANLVVDGNFGGATTLAVRNFQKNNNLAQDGIVGRNTWNKLLNLNPTSEVLRRGNRNSAVLLLQRLLLSYLYPITNLDGIFGPETERAVRAFQTENNLVADGIVGRNTWSSLLASNGRPLPTS
jgi:hypothetical protein